MGTMERNLEETIGHEFKDKKLLKTALTHSSYANEIKKGYQSNERLEFLGDAVLSIVVSEYLFNKFHMAEGDLSKLRAALVCEKSLCGFAGEIELGKHLMLGKGEEQMGGRSRPSILADAFESMIAAIYQDSGLEAARSFILPFITEALDNDHDLSFKDYKTMLQELVQKNPHELLTYVMVEESGPDHNKRFHVEVRLNSNVIGRGVGQSKKNAEQLAAKEALELMGR